MARDRHTSESGSAGTPASRLDELVEENKRLRAEIAEHGQVEEALRHSEQQARSLFENSPDAIFVEDADGNVLDANPAACRLHGMKREALIGRNVLEMVPPESRERVRRDYPKWFGEGMDDYEGESLAADGRRISVEIRARNITYRDQPAVLLHVRDITCRKEAEAALRKVEEDLLQSQKMEALGRLAGGVAHDFNNLLTTIVGYGSLVRDALDAADPARSDSEEVLRAAGRATELTQGLLALSRRQVAQKRPLDLNRLVRNSEKILRRTIGEDVELVIECAENLGTIEADAGHIEQIVINLAINARDSMPEGGKLVIATVNVPPADCPASWPGTARDMGGVCLVSRDTGCGIPDDIRAHVFEPFFTTKSKDRGTGLGLSTVYGIVRQAGGHIEFDSEVGAGTEFRVFFPRIDETPEKPVPPAETKSLPGGSECILVIEDEAAVRTLAVRLLRPLGYEMLSAANAGEALLLCERRKAAVHLVLSDVVMPHMGGPELVRRLRGVRSDFKVLYMTGFTPESIPASKECASPLILKPFTHEELATRVREILDSDAGDNDLEKGRTV